MKKEVIYQRAIGLLTRREHGALELRSKLIIKGAHEDELDEILSQLQAKGYQSDARFVESYIRTQVLRKRGPNKIQFELTRLRIDKNLIDQIMENLAIDWPSLALDAFNKKYNKKGSSPADIKSQMNFLVQRGFRQTDFKHILKPNFKF